MIDTAELVDRYMAVWHEPDAEARRKAVHELWTTDGVQYLEPPQEIREVAATLGVTSALEARGHDAIEVRVTRAYEEFIAPGQYRFQPRRNAARLGDVVKFNWEMVPTGGGDAAGVGLEFLVLGADGRIRIDYQFIEGS